VAPRLRFGFPAKVAWRALLTTLPVWLLLAFAIAYPARFAAYQPWLIAGAAAFCLTLALAVRSFVRFPLYTVANLLEALREGDFSLRGSRAVRGDPLGEVLWEVNTLAETLRQQRLRVEETLALLTKVLAAIELPILAFDDSQCLRFANPAAGRLLGLDPERAKGMSAAALELADCLALANGSTLKRAFAGAPSATWELRLAQFREAGKPQTLLVINDLSRALRREELQAWQRLLRVLGHEINNSLAPISSIASTLLQLLSKDPLPSDWRDDSNSALKVIGDRAEALARFVASYGQLAKLPAPNLRQVSLPALLKGVCQLRQPAPVVLVEVPDLNLDLDPDQIEQALINLIKNAAEAASSNRGGVQVSATLERHWLSISVLDEGLGLASSDNLFVPFYTTKPGGSGIGLVLAQAIAEGHGGRLTLANRKDRSGCCALLSLPFRTQQTRLAYAVAPRSSASSTASPPGSKLGDTPLPDKAPVTPKKIVPLGSGSPQVKQGKW